MTLRLACSLLGLLLLAGSLRAEPMIQLSSPDDLSNINPGQTVTIQVGVTGLTASESIWSLDVPVTFNPSMFSTPFNLAAGSIVPPSADPNDFMGQVAPGLAQGTFAPLNFGADVISDNGTFYSFQVTALSAGRSTFEIGSGASGTSPDAEFFTFTPGAANSLDAVTTPEPGSLAAVCISFAVAAGFARRKIYQALRPS
jgi:hypothetical protein